MTRDVNSLTQENQISCKEIEKLEFENFQLKNQLDQFAAEKSLEFAEILDQLSKGQKNLEVRVLEISELENQKLCSESKNQISHKELETLEGENLQLKAQLDQFGTEKKTELENLKICSESKNQISHKELETLEGENLQLKAQLDQFDTEKKTELAQILDQVSKAGKDLEAQVLELAELENKKRSAEWKADNREAMCVGFEKKILGLESAKDQLESDAVLLKERNGTLIESEKELQSKLVFKDQLLDQDLEIIQGLEGELEDFKKSEKTALENADATEKAKESLFQKNESLKGFQTDLELKILSLEAQRSKILKENQNLDQKIETLASANSDMAQKLQKVEFELLQSQENFKTDQTQSKEFFEAQINGQKSINQDLLSLFDSEKQKAANLNREKSELILQISDLAVTIKCNQQLVAQSIIDGKSVQQENSDKLKQQECLWDKQKQVLESQILVLRTTLEETNNVLEILEEGFRESETQIKQMGGTPRSQKQVNIILKARSNRSLLPLGQNSL